MSGDLTDAIARVADAVSRGEPEEALRLAKAAARSGGDDPHLHMWRGAALLDLGRADEAVSALERALALVRDADAGLLAMLAGALFQNARFDDAERRLLEALAADDTLPEAYDLEGLLLERRGDFNGADRSFARATQLDPETCPPVMRLDRAAFEERVRAAGDRLPPAFRRHLDDVAVTVEPVPPAEILFAESPPLPPDLLGLFVGVSLADRTYFSPGGELPPRIYLFQRNLERHALDADDLEEQIVITLYHELGHYLGLDEDELDRIDLG